MHSRVRTEGHVLIDRAEFERHVFNVRRNERKWKLAIRKFSGEDRRGRVFAQVLEIRERCKLKIEY